MSMRIINRLACGVAPFAMIATTPAFAQDNPAVNAQPGTQNSATNARPEVQSPQPQSAQSAASALGADIVVTAQRREQRLQDVPIAVTAATAADLEGRGISQSQDLNQLVPSLVMTNIGTSSTPFLRGIGNLGTAAGQEASVSTYIDGVYIPSMSAGFFSFNNIARIEVLKGPQGTLFGRNSVGGVIQVVTLDPSYQPNVMLSAGYGNYNTFEGSFYGTAGLSANLAADLAIHFLHQTDGYGTNLVTGQGTGLTHEFNARAKFRLDLGATIVTLSLDYNRERGTTGTSSWGIFPGTVAIGGLTHAGGFHDTSLDVVGGPAIRRPLDLTNGVDNFGGSLRVDHDFGGARFVSLTAARSMPSFYPQDVDVTPLPTVDLYYHYPSEMLSQEFQFLSGTGRSFEWVIGTYAYWNLAQTDPLTLEGSSLAALGGFDRRFARLETLSVAGYAQGTVNITDNTRLTLGARYTYDHRHVQGRDELGTGATIRPVDAAKSWSSPTWRVVLDHHFNPNVMIYAGWNRGFKAGGWGASALFQPAFNPEYLDSFEVGEKATLLNHHLRINTSGFYYGYRDIQVTFLENNATSLINAGRARIYGAELEIEAAPTNQFRLRFAGAYTNAKYTEFTNAADYVALPAGGYRLTQSDVTGNRMPRSPQWSFSTGLSYSVPTDIGEFNFDANLYHSGMFFWEPNNNLRQTPYTVINSELSWAHPNDRFKITLWVRNLTDENYSLHGLTQSTGASSVPAAPRTFGVRLDWRMR